MRRLLLAFAAAAVTLAGGIAGPLDAQALSEKEFGQLRELVKPSAGENLWLQVNWVHTLWEAHEKAVKEGKPIAVFTTGGEPLGIC
jgi:hypothetical protein